MNRLLHAEHYPSPAWTLTILLRGPESIDINAIAEDGKHRLSVSASVTSTWPAGAYWYAVRVESNNELLEIERGSIQVLPNLATQAAGFSGATHAEKVLAAIEAVLEKRATRDQERYKINDRELYRTPITDLLKLRSVYRDELRREYAAKRGPQSGFGRVVRVRL